MDPPDDTRAFDPFVVGLNNGSFQLNACGVNTDLDVSGVVTLRGTGAVTLSNDLNNHIMGYGQGNGSLLNQSVIQGAGTIGWGGSIGAGNTLTNDVKGTIYADQGNSLTIGVTSGSFTNNGTLKVKNGSTLYIQGAGFTNFSGGNTLTGGMYLVSGTFEFDGASIENNAASITLIGNTAGIISQLGANALANFAANAKVGSFSLTSGALLSATVASGNFTNAGTLTISAKSNLQISAPSPKVAAYIQTGGTTTVDGTLHATGGATIEAGKLYGKGTISTYLVSSGSVTAGDSATKPGVLSSSTYSQSSTGSLNIALGGLTAGTQYGHLAVSNGASLGGTLNVTLINGFVPAVGDAFSILTGSAISGKFSTVHLPSLAGAHFAIAYNSSSVTLTVVSGS